MGALYGGTLILWYASIVTRTMSTTLIFHASWPSFPMRDSGICQCWIVGGSYGDLCVSVPPARPSRFSRFKTNKNILWSILGSSPGYVHSYNFTGWTWLVNGYLT